MDFPARPGYNGENPATAGGPGGAAHIDWAARRPEGRHLMHLDVTAIGEVLIDFAPMGENETGYPKLEANPGGAPGNFLAALAAYGARTAMLAKVGDDAFGRMLVETLAQAGIETRGILRDGSVFTTLAFVTLSPEGDRSFSFARKPGADTCLTWDEVDRRLIDEAKVFHFGTLSLTGEPSRTATREAVAYAKGQGKQITFDPNLRLPLWPSEAAAREEILWGLQQADVVKISQEEVAFLWGCGFAEGARKLLEEYGVALAMVTLGAEGCYLANQNAAVRIPCPAVRPVDTTGAGDIFGGSAVNQLLRLGAAPEDLTGEQLERIGSFAATAASLSTQRRGGIPSIPAEAEVRRALGWD